MTRDKTTDVPGSMAHGLRTGFYDCGRAGFADGTNLLDKDILAEYGVGRKEFLDSLDDLGVDRGNLFRTSGRTSEAGAFKEGLENILLSPEERAIKEQEFADEQAAKKKDDKDAFYVRGAD